jgi:serine/threonine-protein kinase
MGERPIALQSAAGARAGAVAAPPRSGRTTTVMPGRADPQARVRTGVQRTVPPGQRGGPPPGQHPSGVAIPARYREQSRTGWYALAAFFALIALGIGGFLLFNALANDDDPTSRQLPDYVGQELSVVVADLTNRDLTYTVVEEPSERFPDGVVHRTDPGAGTVMPEGERVQLFVNPTDDTAVIPEVAGMTVDEARRALEAAGFQVIEVANEENHDVAEGRVIRTDPAEGEEVGVQDTVTLFVAGPGGTVTTESGIEVPHLIGDSEESARSQLSELGLEVDVTYQTAPGSQWIGNVMDQSPYNPTRVDEGDTVSIVVGDAPEPPEPTTPRPTTPQPTTPQPTTPQPTTPQPTSPPPTTAAPTTPAPTTPRPATTAGPTTT